ncbi:hypothetical protein [Streptomyces sp. NPDC046985]|uniref:hypothetical protein n=1 Tax=Streptomyces sp. NPDC046985 TaxID=3155377 RepID=UPI0033F5FE36
MDQFRGYCRVIEATLARAGYADAEFTVRRAQGATEGRWVWIGGAAELTGREWPDGLELVWSSSMGWAYRERGGDKLVALPVPALAAPEAITALLPALMDGRRDHLPASEDRWEHAAVFAQWAESAAVLGDDKNDAAYQRHEEEAATFDRWQTELDGAPPAEPAVAPETDGASGAAGATAHGAGDRTVADAAEQARRAHVNTVLTWAVRARNDRRHHADPELFGVLCDFFTRAVVFPGQMDPHDEQRHTSDPSRALSHLLIQHLEDFGLDLEDLPELELPETSVVPVGDAVAECVAQALRSSSWFTAAASVPGSDGGQVGFHTVFGARGVLHLGDVSGGGDAKV